MSGLQDKVVIVTGGARGLGAAAAARMARDGARIVVADLLAEEGAKTAAEIGEAVAFLISDAASCITGAELAVDGGWTAGEVVMTRQAGA